MTIEEKDSIDILREEIEQEKKKLILREKMIKTSKEKIDERERSLLEEFKKLEDEKQKINEERFNLQKECEEKANYIVENIKERNKELALKVTELSRFEIDKSMLENEIKSKDIMIKQISNELYDCKSKLKELEQFSGIDILNELQLKNKALLLAEEKNEKLKNEIENLRKKVNELEEKASNGESISEYNDILQMKIQRANSQISYLKKLEEKKGIDKDSSEGIFREIIDAQIEIDKNTANINYCRDDRFISNFINFCKNNGFIYEEKLVRSFLASLRSSKLTILKGYSGTGKSSLPKLFAKFIHGECVIVPVQPNWRTKQDIMGFYNYFTNRFIPTELTKTLIRANVSSNRIFLVVLDEMNLARVEYYFSEFNSKLEMDYKDRKIELFEGTVSYDKTVEEYIKDNKIQIPDNVFFIGTINEDDSVSPISDKIFDRAQVVEFMQLPTSKSVGSLDSAINELKDNEYTSFKSFNKVDSSQKADLEIINQVNAKTKEYFDKVIGFRSIRQIEDFVKYYTLAGGDFIEAIDIQLVSKFIPKLKFLYSEEQIDTLEQLLEEIKELFEKKYKCSEKRINNLMIVNKIESIIKERRE